MISALIHLLTLNITDSIDFIQIKYFIHNTLGFCVYLNFFWDLPLVDILVWGKLLTGYRVFFY